MKTKSIIAALLLAASGAFAQVPSYVPTNGLVGWWPFNGNANDESGNGYNGNINGAVLTADRNGISNKAYYYNGTSSYIGIGDMPIGISYQPLKVSIWWQKSTVQTTGFCTLLSDYDGPTGTGDYVFAFSSSIYHVDKAITINRRSAPYEIQVKTNPIIGPAWHHLAIVYDGINAVNYYQDGVAITSLITWNGTINGTLATPTYDASKNFYNNPFWRIGCIRWSGTLQEFFEGKLDDIAIWNRALTQQEITALYNAQTCNSTSNTITADGPTTFCAGNFVNLTSDVVGGTYQWKKNGINIATNSTSRTFKATSTGSYTCVATCNGTALTSNAIAVTSKTNASASITASGATSFCAGDSVTLNCTNLGSNYSVQWYRTNVSIENATAYTQVVKQPGTYKVVTKNLTNGCSRISGSAITTNVNCRIANYSNMSTTGNLNDEARFDATELSNGIKIYPNPNNGSFQFKYEGEESGDAQLQVINTMGQTVYRANVNIEDGFLLKEIMLGDNFQKGIYIVRLLINGGQNDSRVLIQ